MTELMRGNAIDNCQTYFANKLLRNKDLNILRIVLLIEFLFFYYVVIVASGVSRLGSFV